MSISVEVWGNYALFSRPELKTERVTYDVMTPSAARGLLESVFWHPGMSYIIDRIHVCAPIHLTNVRRNEVRIPVPKIARSEGVAAKMADERTARLEPLYIEGDIRQQRAALILQDVRYVIDAHFVMTRKAKPEDNYNKFLDIITRRVAKGQYYSQPYFGCREFPAHFKPCETIPPCPDELKGERDLGLMAWDMDYSNPQNIKGLFFRAKMVDGVIEIPTRDSGEVYG